MGRQGSVVSTPPPAAVQSPPAMPPMPPKPPKKRYLMENPPRPGNGLLQLAEVSSQQRHAPPAGDPGNYTDHSMAGHGHPLAGYAPQPPVNTLNGGRVVHPCVNDEDMPLNLTTASTTEVKLSRIVDRVVEKMLKKGGMDNGKSGDPLRLWFTNQFEIRQRNECSSSGSSPSPRQKSVSPQLPSPAAAAGSPGQPSPGVLDTLAADQGGGVMELRIGMSDTINRVIDNVYRQQSQPSQQPVVTSAAASKRCEVTSCSSDRVNSTTSLLEPLSHPPPPPPPPRQTPSSMTMCQVKRRSPASTAVSAAERRAERTQRVKRAAVVSVAAPVFCAAAVMAGGGGGMSPAQASPPTVKRARSGPSPTNRVSAPTSDDDDVSRSSLVIDESRPVAGDAPEAPDSRSSELSHVVVDQSPSTLEKPPPTSQRSPALLVEGSSPGSVERSPGSPRRRPRKRTAPADSGLGAVPDSGVGGRGSRKRKVGKADIVRIQKEGEDGMDAVPATSPAKDRAKSQPK